MVSDAAVEAGEVRIPYADLEIPAFQATPPGAGPFPIVVLAPEIYGVNDNMRDICVRFAREGFYAIAPDLFIRQGDVSKLTDTDEIRSIVQRVPDAQATADLDRAADFAADRTGDIRRLYMTGFCWGGRLAWVYAASSGRLRAAVAWYGRLIADADEIHPNHPISLVSELKCPVLGLYGGKDPHISLQSVTRMREEIEKEQKNSDIFVYPEAGHGFFADYRPSYHADAAADGWRRMLAWFGEGPRT